MKIRSTNQSNSLLFLNYYCYEVYEGNSLVGKTRLFDIQDIHHSWIQEEVKRIKSNAKRPFEVSIHLAKIEENL